MEAIKVVETGIPSTAAMSFMGKSPALGEAAFVAPTASVIGDVTVGAGSSIWYGAKVRGDVNSISIGANSSIGDCVMVHVAKIQGDHPTVVGDNVSVGANAILHACTIGSNVVVGMGATVLDGAKVEGPSVIAPGSLVTPGKVVEAGTMWAGSPAAYLRDLTEDEIKFIGASASEANGLAAMHAYECAKDYQQVTQDLEDAEDERHRNPDYFPKTDPEMADVPRLYGVDNQGTKPHLFAENDRYDTKFAKDDSLAYQGTPGAEDAGGLANYGTQGTAKTETSGKKAEAVEEGAKQMIK